MVVKNNTEMKLGFKCTEFTKVFNIHLMGSNLDTESWFDFKFEYSSLLNSITKRDSEIQVNYIRGMYVHNQIKNNYIVELNNITACLTTSLSTPTLILGRHNLNNVIVLKVEPNKNEKYSLSEFAIQKLQKTLKATIIFLLLVIAIIYKQFRNSRREKSLTQLYSNLPQNNI